MQGTGSKPDMLGGEVVASIGADAPDLLAFLPGE